jgi:tRNA pseudouridine38-40 synthase
MSNLKLTLEYDGTHYHGWQRQPSLSTIQGILEEAVRKVAGEKVTVIGAGRTDAGVHALGQVANFKTKASLKPDAWQRALNSVLPEDIVVRQAEKVPERFHARYDATGKIYQYRILNRSFRSAILRKHQWVVYPSLKPVRMRVAARHLLGRHDFSAFQAGPVSDRKRSTICTVKKLTPACNGDEIFITIEADRFLHQMIRMIVGTLVEVGKGKRNPIDIRMILNSKDQSRAGQTAPPRGLFLMTVKY